LGGAFDGGLGIDTGDFTQVGSQAFVVSGLGTLDGYDVTNVPLVAGDLKDIDALVGSANKGNSLTGMNTDSTFTLTGTDAGTYVNNAALRTLTFTTIENLLGGTGNDTLVVKPAGTLAGTFDGGAGVDTGDLSQLTAVQQITIQGLGATDG